MNRQTIELAIGAAVAVLGLVGVAVISMQKSEHLADPKYKFCPQPDITAYELARIYNNANRADLVAKQPDLRRHICEVK